MAGAATRGCHRDGLRAWRPDSDLIVRDPSWRRPQNAAACDEQRIEAIPSNCVGEQADSSRFLSRGRAQCEQLPPRRGVDRRAKRRKGPRPQSLPESRPVHALADERCEELRRRSANRRPARRSSSVRRAVRSAAPSASSRRRAAAGQSASPAVPKSARTSTQAGLVVDDDRLPDHPPGPGDLVRQYRG